MANGTVIPVNTMTINSFTAGTACTSLTLDSGTVAVTVPTATTIMPSRAMFVITNNGTANLSVVAVAGANPPAQRASVGSVAQTVGSAATYVFGPAESMQFGQSTGYMNFTFTPSAGTVSATVTCYQLPKA